MNATTHDDAGRHMRLVPDGRPAVYATSDTVVLQTDAETAHTLSRILAHYEVLTRGQQTVQGYDPAIWQNVYVDLLAAKSRLNLQMVPVIQVGPVIRR